MRKFDYVILSEHNEWLSTGQQVTEAELTEELIRLKNDDPGRELIVCKSENLIFYSV